MKRIVMVLLMVTALVQAAEYRKIPDWYYKIKSVKVQKKAFFDILRPLVEEENQKILEERAFVKEVFQEMESKPIIEDEKLVRLAQIAKKYRIKDIYNESEYMMKVDSLPVSLVLAQAALESGWGKSRFARQANNLFGEWTWGKRGLIPKRRDPGKRHKIKIFDSLRDSIASYMLNLNRHRAYREFRVARYVAKKTRRSFSGLEAATTMKRYSGIGRRYTRLVSSIIKRNRLHLD